MNLGYSYSWRMPAGDLAQVRAVIEALHQRAVELGGEVGDVIVLSGDEAQAVRLGARQAVLFTATVPGASVGKYGLASTGDSWWSWSGAVVISSARTVSQLHAAAASLGVEVTEGYAGTVFESKKNAHGLVEVEQRAVFDWTDF